jgi:hypothetical protein
MIQYACLGHMLFGAMFAALVLVALGRFLYVYFYGCLV